MSDREVDELRRQVRELLPYAYVGAAVIAFGAEGVVPHWAGDHDERGGASCKACAAVAMFDKINTDEFGEMGSIGDEVGD